MICTHPLGFTTIHDGHATCSDCKAPAPGQCVCGAPFRTMACQNRAHLNGPRLEAEVGTLTAGPLNIERENAAAAHVKADWDEVYSKNADRVHNAFVSGAEWERANTSTASSNGGSAQYGWEDFEEDDSVDAIAGKFILTITEDGEESAVIVHRFTAGIDNECIMDEKRERAQRIVEALNAAVVTR